MDRALVSEWIAACGATYGKNAAGVYVPDPNGDKVGWDIDSRDDPLQWDQAKFPVCNVYQSNSKTVPVALAAYEKRLTQLQNYFSANLADADIVAFEEVSGEQAVRDALPNNGAGYEVCSFTGFKVQRLAIAWKSALGAKEACQPEESLSLPATPFE